MDYDSTLSYLQSLLGNSQTQNASQYGSGLDFLKQQLGQQGTQFDKSLGLQTQIADWQNALANKQLGESGREFDVSSALQKVIADWQNQLANKQFGLQEGAQRFGQNMATNQMDYSRSPAARLAEMFPQMYADATANANAKASRYDPYSTDYVGKIFAGNGATYNPYTAILSLLSGVPTINAGENLTAQVPAKKIA